MTDDTHQTDDGTGHDQTVQSAQSTQGTDSTTQHEATPGQQSTAGTGDQSSDVTDAAGRAETRRRLTDDSAAYEVAADGTIITTPTVKPVLLRLAVTLGVGLGIIAIIFLNPTLFGTTEVTNIALIIAQILVVIAIVRLLVKLIVLRNTEYVLTDRAVRREYQLLARSKSREVPYDLVRSHERNQGRIEYILDVGSISLNQGLGDLTLESLRDHEDVYEIIREEVEE